MDMGTGQSDRLAAAIAALPYRTPAAGFRARVLAAVAAEAAANERLGWAIKGLAGLTASWAGLVGLVSAGPLWSLVADYAPLAAEPGGAAQVLRLLGARAALLAGKLAGAAAFARDLGGLALAYLPPAHEIALAALISAAVIRLAAVRKTAAQKI
jgi:hypothetical protein